MADLDLLLTSLVTAIVWFAFAAGAIIGRLYAKPKPLVVILPSPIVLATTPANDEGEEWRRGRSDPSD